MKVKLTYPPASKRKAQRRDVIAILRWPMLAAAYGCPIVNLCVGGKAWSPIVLWALYMGWSLLLSPDVIEYNRISQIIKLVSQSCIQLLLIDLLLSPGWASVVVPLVCAAGLLTVGVLFFSDLRRQRHNMLPMLLSLLAALLLSLVCLFILRLLPTWPFIAMGGMALALLLSCCFVIGPRELLRELRKLFHS